MSSTDKLVIPAYLLVRGLGHAHLRLVVDAVGEFLEHLGDGDPLADEVARAPATVQPAAVGARLLRPPAPRPPRSPPPLSDLICASRAATWDSAAASCSVSASCVATSAVCAAAFASVSRLTFLGEPALHV